MRFRTATTLVIAALGAPAAFGATDLALDVNTISMQAVNSFGAAVAFGGLTHTGAVSLSNGPFSVLASVAIDDVTFATTPGLGLQVRGQIDLLGGLVSGGFIQVLMSDGSLLSTDILGGVGQVTAQAGQGFKIDGLLTHTALAGSGSPGLSHRFAGVDVSPFLTEAPIVGSFLSFAYSPNRRGTDANADLDIHLQVDGPVVPLPTGACLAIGGLAMGGAVRRRR